MLAIEEEPAEMKLGNMSLATSRTHPCVDCGEANPNKLEFDHHGDKEFDITHMLYKGFSIPHIAAEISKCEARCANCHRRKLPLNEVATERQE